MKILILTNNLSRASFRLRIGDYLDELKRQNILCTVSALPKKTTARWRLLKSTREYDALLIHRKCFHLLDAFVLRLYRPALIFFDFDDAIMHSTSCPESDWTSHYRLFRRTARMADVMIAGNETLADYARRYCDNVHVLPTGLDIKAYDGTDVRKPDEKIRLVWIGSKSTLPFLEQLRSVLEKIGAAHKNVVLRIIADVFFDLENMEVEKCPWTIDGHIKDLQECDIGIAPLPDNRFTRGKCAFKMLQYFATGLPVIASPVGVNKTYMEQSGGGMIATTDDEWERAVEILIADDVLRGTVGQRGRNYVKQFDCKVIADRLAKILSKKVFDKISD